MSNTHSVQKIAEFESMMSAAVSAMLTGIYMEDAGDSDESVSLDAQGRTYWNKGYTQMQEIVRMGISLGVVEELDLPELVSQVISKLLTQEDDHDEDCFDEEDDEDDDLDCPFDYD